MSRLASVGSAPRRIGVFRALQLGDLLCTTPALRALKAAYPDSLLSLISLPWASELADRLPYVDAFLPFPGFPGLPEIAPRLEQIPEFFKRAQAMNFDLLVQMHGSGALVNPIVVACGAKTSAGFFRRDEYCPDPLRYIEWPERGTEIERYLSLIAWLGLPVQSEQLDFPITDIDRLEVRTLAPQLRPHAYVCVHVGAQLESRRWPAQRFAETATALAGYGFPIVLTGTADEAQLVREVEQTIERASARVINLCGRTTLWQLGALIASAALLVCNDTGVSHIAAAFATPSVVVCSGADTARWSPQNKTLHVVLAHPVPCRPCAHRICPFGHECALGVAVDAVVHEARRLLDLQRDSLAARAPQSLRYSGPRDSRAA